MYVMISIAKCLGMLYPCHDYVCMYVLGTETCGVGNVFSPDDLWFGSDTYASSVLICNLHLDV